jgi:outer membrane lipoprotein-sorting protein
MGWKRDFRLAALSLLFLAAAAQAEDNPDLRYAQTARKGEALLDAADAEKALAGISERFKANPCVKAVMTTQVSDLMGDRAESGVLLLDRSGRVLRKFTKPDEKIWLLNGAQLSEYVPKLRREVAVKDFSKAPKVLDLLQAAVTVDVRQLKQYFLAHVFQGPAGAAKDAQYCRLVLVKNPECKQPLPYRRIEAQISAKGLLFREIEYIPDQGDSVIERYSDIEAVEKPKDEEFTRHIPADAPRKVDFVEAPGAAK